jgi:hypothetical protein
MARPRTPQPVKLIAGLLSGDPDLLRRALQLLAKRWGPIDQTSPVWPFTMTEYYAAEMGAGLQRQFIGFERLIGPQELAEIKRETNALEEQIASQCLSPDISRPVNIDPGYVDLGKLVLATTKDRAHRIYLNAGIYAEVTLQFVAGGWQPQPWTYPDYAAPDYHPFFTQVRERLRARRAAEGPLDVRTEPT